MSKQFVTLVGCSWRSTAVDLGRYTMQKFLQAQKLMKKLKMDFYQQHFFVLFLDKRKYQTIS